MCAVATTSLPPAWNHVIGMFKAAGVKPEGWPGMIIKPGFYSSSVTELLNLTGHEAPAVIMKEWSIAWEQHAVVFNCD